MKNYESLYERKSEIERELQSIDGLLTITPDPESPDVVVRVKPDGSISIPSITLSAEDVVRCASWLSNLYAEVETKESFAKSSKPLPRVELPTRR